MPKMGYTGYIFMENQIRIAGLKIDALSKEELLATLRSRITANKKTWITTLYSEFLYAALRGAQTLEMLNQADIAVPDGVGIFWAHKYLSIPLTTKSYYGKILQAFWQAKYSLAAILLYPKFIKVPSADKISGADLIWDIAKLATENNLSIYLLGGFGDTPKLVAESLVTHLNDTVSYIHGREFRKHCFLKLCVQNLQMVLF